MLNSASICRFHEGSCLQAFYAHASKSKCCFVLRPALCAAHRATPVEAREKTETDETLQADKEVVLTAVPEPACSSQSSTSSSGARSCSARRNPEHDHGNHTQHPHRAAGVSRNTRGSKEDAALDEWARDFARSRDFKLRRIAM